MISKDGSFRLFNIQKGKIPTLKFNIKLMRCFAIPLLSLLLPQATGAWSFNGVRDAAVRHSTSSRRSFLTNASIFSTAAILSKPKPSFAVDDEQLIDVYFGCGCFWHVQQ